MTEEKDELINLVGKDIADKISSLIQKMIENHTNLYTHNVYVDPLDE